MSDYEPAERAESISVYPPIPLLNKLDRLARDSGRSHSNTVRLLVEKATREVSAYGQGGIQQWQK